MADWYLRGVSGACAQQSEMNRIVLKPRWKEELVATSAEGALVFEFTMGVNHVYFPSQASWERQVPAWALDKREQYLAECEKWCSANRVPLSVTDEAWVAVEKA